MRSRDWLQITASKGLLTVTSLRLSETTTIKELAASGLGWEDIVASLRREGVACDEAAIRSYVLGSKWK